MATEFGIEPVVNVIISVGDRPVTGSDFVTPMILTSHNVNSDTFRIYTSSNAVLEDGYAAGSNVVKMAEAIFGGAFPPTQLIIGQRTLTDYRADFDVANDTAYTINMKVGNGTTVFTQSFTFTSDSSATNIEIAEGLATLIEADPNIGPLVAAVGTTGTLVITPDAGGTVSVGAATTNITLTSTSSETVADAMASILNETSSFFFVLSDTRVEADMLALSSWAEANKRLYFVADNDPVLWTSGTTDIASQLQGLTRHNSHVFAQDDADKALGEAAVVGAWAGIAPGQAGLYAARLSTSLTQMSVTEVTFAKGKNANIHAQRGGAGFYEDGVMSSGRDAKIARGVIALESEMEQQVFSYIANQRQLGLEVPYTDAGIEAIGGQMSIILNRYLAIGFLTEYEVLAPLAEDQTQSDRQNGVIEIPFEATAQVGIKRVTIRGFISL